MKKGVLCLGILLLSVGTANAANWMDAVGTDAQKAVELQVSTAKVEMLLPPGTDQNGVRGSLAVERMPVTERTLPNGRQVTTVPVVYTFVNQWEESWIFDGYNEAVLTDMVGNQHFASAVVREQQLLPAGVSGLVPAGYTVSFTAFYDMDEASVASNFDELKLDLRYLNHGHPYTLSAIVSANSAMSLVGSMTQVTSEPGAPERPQIVEVAPPPAPAPPAAVEPVKPRPVVTEPVQPAPVPEPVIVQQQPEPVITQPMPVAPPPAPVMAEEPAAPAPIQLSGPCNPCCRPCSICIPLPNIGGFVCCVFDKVGKFVCCTTNAACGLVHGSVCLAENLVCGSLKTVCCVTNQVLKGTCGMLSCVCNIAPCNTGGACNLNPCGALNGVTGLVNQVVCVALSPLQCLGIGGGSCGALGLGGGQMTPVQ